MTEEYLEKKAEEYVPNIRWHDYSSEDLREEMKLCYREGMKDGYQEGLKAKINATTISDCPVKDEWHKVADGDLPKDDRYYLICSDRGNYYVSKYHCNKNYWIGIQNQYVSIKNVIAWCEIPQYEEE